MTAAWLFWSIAQWAMVVLLFLLVIFAILYVVTLNKKKRLVSLAKRPNEFIISVYENLRCVMAIFGLKYDNTIPPVQYAKQVEEKFNIGTAQLLKLTAKFEEARYSQHLLQVEDAISAADAYNHFLKTLFSKYKKSSLLIKYYISIVRRIPLFIKR